MARSAGDPLTGLDTPDDAVPAGRPRLLPEVVLIGLCYAVYSFVRNLVPGHHSVAMQHAYELLDTERAMRLDIEFAVNRLFAAAEWLGIAANYYYATLHFAVTIGVLGWLYVRRPAHYVTYRRMLFVTTITALLGFWLYPLAPPRMLPGFYDTVLLFNTWGLYDSSPIASVSNQYAAMPSLHTAWSLWCALAMIHFARSRYVKILAACHPTLTMIVIVGTANHFILDLAGGALTLLIGMAVTGTLGVLPGSRSLQPLRATTPS